MRWPKWGVAAWAVLAGLAFWAHLSGPERILGVDVGAAGFAITLILALLTLHALRTAPKSELDEVISPGEWRAWGGLVTSVIIVACVLLESSRILGATDLRDLEGLGDNVVFLLIALAVVGSVLNSRWKDRVQSDERDREIEVRSVAWGRGALALLVFSVVVLLGASPAEKLAWATHVAIAHLLVLAIVLGFLVEYAHAVVCYWRDRRP